MRPCKMVLEKRGPTAVYSIMRSISSITKTDWGDLNASSKISAIRATFSCSPIPKRWYDAKSFA